MISRKIIKILCLLMVGLWSTFSFSATPGWNISGRVGYSNFELPDISPYPPISQSSFAFGFGIGYNFPTSKPVLLGLELNSSYMGSVSTLNIYVGEFLLAGHYFKNNFDTFLKGGIAVERFTDSYGYLEASSNTAPLIAVGIGYAALKKHLEPFIQVSHIFAGDGPNGAIANTAVFICQSASKIDPLSASKIDPPSQLN